MMRIALLLILVAMMTACGVAPQRGSAPVVERSPEVSEEVLRDPPPTQSTAVIERAPREVGATTTVPNSAVLALLDTARQQRQQHKYVAAAASLERAIRISPRDGQLYLELAKVRFQQGDSAQAAQMCKKAVALSNNSAQTKFECGVLLGSSG